MTEDSHRGADPGPVRDKPTYMESGKQDVGAGAGAGGLTRV